MIHYLLIFVAAVFVNNVVFSQFLGICPFLGVSKKIDTALGMGAAVTFVLALSTMCTFLLQRFVLDHPQEGITRTLPSPRGLPTADHDELLCARGGNLSHSEGVQSTRERGLRRIDSTRLHAGTSCLRGYQRAASTYPARSLDEGDTHRPHLGRHPSYGLHGLQRDGTYLVLCSSPNSAPLSQHALGEGCDIFGEGAVCIFLYLYRARVDRLLWISIR